MQEDWAPRIQKAWRNRMIELEAVILQGWETLYLIMNDSLQGQYMQVQERAG